MPDFPLSPDNTERFFAKVEKGDGCWTWIGRLGAGGYGRLGEQYAHRLSYRIHKGEIPPGLCVCHTCDNRRCVNPSHLWLGTQKDNAVDKALKGRSTARLSPDQVREIRALQGKFTQAEIARKYKVAKNTVWGIHHRKYREYVEDQP